jgi:hypothetical protein
MSDPERSICAVDARHEPCPRCDRSTDTVHIAGRLPKVRTAAQRYGLAPLYGRPNHCSYCRVVNAARRAVASICRAQIAAQLAVARPGPRRSALGCGLFQSVELTYHAAARDHVGELWIDTVPACCGSRVRPETSALTGTRDGGRVAAPNPSGLRPCRGGAVGRGAHQTHSRGNRARSRRRTPSGDAGTGTDPD